MCLLIIDLEIRSCSKGMRHFEAFAVIITIAIAVYDMRKTVIQRSTWT
jgi:hypothetical protein